MNREITLKYLLDAIDGWSWDWKKRCINSYQAPNWKRVAEELRRQRLNSIILKQNAQLRKDGYTGPFLGACLLTPPPKN